MKKFFAFPIPLFFLLASICVMGCRKESTDSVNLEVASNNIVDNPSVYKTSGKTNQILDALWYGDCTGEYIHVTGQIVATYNIIQKENSTNYATQFHYQNVKGIGMTSGNRYIMVGHNSSHLYQNFSFDDFNKVATVSGRVMWITPGQNNNLVAVATFKVIQNGKGDLIINNDTYSLECE